MNKDLINYKHCKTMDDSLDDQMTVIEVDSFVDNCHPPPYLKLIADCWEHIFDYLPLKEIISIGQTCTRMQKMTGYYLREYFPEILCTIDGRSTRITYSDRFPLQTDLRQYISKLCIDGNVDYYLDATTFSAVNTLIFSSVELSKNQIEYTKNLLAMVEHIQLKYCVLPDEFFVHLIALCPKLKSLHIQCCRMDDNALHTLFLQSYPSLEYLQFQPLPRWANMQINEMQQFLENQPNLKHFEMDYRVLWANRHLLNETNTRLDLLTVRFPPTHDDSLYYYFVDYLQMLHKRGFYKTLNLSFDYSETENNFEYLSNATSKLSALEMLNTPTDSIVDLSRLTNLKQLEIRAYDSGSLIENVARNLKKLKRLTFYTASMGDILPFVRHSKRLKTINVYHSHDIVLDLHKLNEERKQLEDACPVSICVLENVYLPTKWKIGNLHLSLVKIIRLNAHNFNAN